MNLITHQSSGGQILKIGDILYLSPCLEDAKSTPRRGGIPILFPQFSDAGKLKKHGFARNLEWIALKDSAPDPSQVGKELVTYQLRISSKDYPDWPHDALLILGCYYDGDQALVELSINNIGDSRFSWTGGLHPYFLVEDLLNVEVHGLLMAPEHNKYRPDRHYQTQSSLRFNGEPYESLFDTDHPLRLLTQGRYLKLSMSGFQQWMIWNPGHEAAKTIIDLPDEDWKRFICIEPVIASEPLFLEPQEKWVGSLNIQICQYSDTDHEVEHDN